MIKIVFKGHIRDETELRAFFLSPLLEFLYFFYAFFSKRERKRGKERVMAKKMLEVPFYPHTFSMKRMQNVMQKYYTMYLGCM